MFADFGWRGAHGSSFYWSRMMATATQQVGNPLIIESRLTVTQLGLHKDPHPSLPEDEHDFRRRVFHEVSGQSCRTTSSWS